MSSAALPPFAHSAALSLGVELELQIVNTHDYDLAPQAADLLRLLARERGLPGEIKPEITQSMIEISTGICHDSGEVLAELQLLQSALLGACQQLELALCGGGTHPFQHWKHQRIYAAPRFAELSSLYGYLSKQFTVFGQHVHIGCESGDAALPLLHGLSRYIPHLIALASSSPFVQGEDTGFDSARLNAVFAFPMSGRAPFVQTWGQFENYFGKMARTGIVQGMKDFYWDIRPKPEFGTIEVRVLDTPLTLAKAAALAGFIQCLARWLQQDAHLSLHEDDYLVYTFNRFQACRFGLDGVYVDPSTGEQLGLREHLQQLLVHLAPHAVALRALPALALLQSEMSGLGNDAAWLRQQQGREPMLAELVRQSCLRWAQGA